MSSEEEDGRVSEGEEEEEEEEETFSKKKKDLQQRRRQGRDDEASEEDDDDEEEEDEDAPNEYEKDDFLVDEVEEEEGGEEEEGDDEENRKERKRRKREELELDEDDYDLIAEANPDFRPPAKKGSGPRLKRLKKAGGLDGDAGAEEDGGTRRARTQEELQQELFGADEDGEEQVEEERRPEVEEEEEDFSENEMDGFIVDEEFDENGNLVPKRKKMKNKGAERRGVVASSAALQEAQDIFGGVDELLEQYKNREREGEDDVEEGFDDLHVDEDDMEDDEGAPRGRRPSKAAKQAMRAAQRAYEPSLLEERFMTDRDERIRSTDIPERFQVLEEQYGPMPETEDAKREAEWIYQQLFNIKYTIIRPEYMNLYDPDLRPEVEEELRSVLVLMHEEKLEIPYIGMYRKEKCRRLLERVAAPPPTRPKEEEDDESQSHLQKFELLWSVAELDRKWMALRQRKRRLEKAYKTHIMPSIERGSENAKQWSRVLSEIQGLLKDAPSDAALDDVEARARLLLPEEDPSLAGARHKRPQRSSLYAYCKSQGLAEVAAKFGSVRQLGANLQKGFVETEVEDHPEAPEMVAAPFLGLEFKEPADVLRGARQMAAVEIAADPAVRAAFREKFMPPVSSEAAVRPGGAIVSTKPTPRGMDVIDEYHQYGPVKWLYRKPAKDFEDGLWLLVLKAKEEGLIEVTVRLPEEETDQLRTLLSELYLSQNVSKNAQLWNEQRRQILAKAFDEFLVPAMEAEVRATLTQRARRFVVGECEKALWKLAARAPFARKKADLDDTNEDEHACRVLAVCWGPGRPATTVVMLDERGELVDTLYTGSLGSKGLGGPHAKERWEEDKRKLEEFIKEHKPHVGVVGGANLRCKNLFEDVNQVIYNIVEVEIEQLAAGLDTLHVFYADESIPLLYEKSKVSESQLSGQPEMVRRAVALGRAIQNPLAALAALCGPGREVALLRMHAMQGLVSQEELWGAVERVMTTISTQVGIDVNTAIHHEWLFSPLQFVPGLGPRKAQALQQALAGRGRLTVRKDLLNFKWVDKRVFINAAGSLRTRPTAAAAHAEDMDPLDETRIHPLQYNVATALCKAAWLAEQDLTAEEANEDDLEMAVQEIAERPDLIKKVDLERFAREHAAEHGDLGPTLQLIKEELLKPYAEWRVPYRQPNVDELFSLLTGETEETLKKGQIVQATVRRVMKERIFCALESGLTAFIKMDELSDDGSMAAAEIIAKLAEDQVLTACVIEIDKREFKVELSCKGSYLRRERHFQKFDWAHYWVDPAVVEEYDRAKKKKEARRQYRPRMIQHPLFKNCNLLEATEMLDTQEIGDVIIRPSSKGPTHLSMTIKFYTDVYAQIDIEEGGKDKADPTSFLKLGSTLKIGDEVFEDLDEVMARYIDPFVDFLRKMLEYRKFKAGTKNEVDELLKREKAQNPQRVAYAISVSQQHAGAFMLSYVRNQNPHHEYISISSKGYRFRHQHFTSPDRLIQYFQKHINDPVVQQEAAPPRRAPASVVPLASQRPPQGHAQKAGGWDQGAPRPPQQDHHNGHQDWQPSEPSQPYNTTWGAGWSQPGPPLPPPGPPPPGAPPPPPPGPPQSHSAEWAGHGDWAPGNGYGGQQGYAQYQGGH